MINEPKKTDLLLKCKKIEDIDLTLSRIPKKIPQKKQIQMMLKFLCNFKSGKI